jgi:diacylglycerol kinase family enzyme
VKEQKNASDPSKIILLVCGGDGSLINLLMKAQAKGLNLDITPCCVLPYGTGNDFAR